MEILTSFITFSGRRKSTKHTTINEYKNLNKREQFNDRWAMKMILERVIKKKKKKIGDNVQNEF